jgi:hypothetical protein
LTGHREHQGRADAPVMSFCRIGVFVAAREPPRRESGGGTASLPRQPADMDKPLRKAA